MCEPVSLAMGAMNAAGQIGQHQAAEAGVKGRNRAKLKNFEAQNRQYLTDVMFDNAEWKNEVQVQDIEQDQIYQSMVSQWSEQDQQLDKMFAQADQKIEKAIVEMYENEYAGTGTGRTAARLAGKSAKKLGQYKSEILHAKMMAQEETDLRKDIIHTEAGNKSFAAFEKIRFAPIHGPTPMAPELEAAPSKAGLVLGLAQTALGTAAAAGAFKAPDIGKGLGDTGAFELTPMSSEQIGASFSPDMPLLNNASYGMSPNAMDVAYKLPSQAQLSAAGQPWGNILP